jgi:hypothetical protein
MNKVMKRKWLAALRSGKFQQGNGLLRREAIDPTTGEITTTHCCLGVLCEAIKGVARVHDAPHPEQRYSPVGFAYECVRDYTALPSTLRDAAGLTDEDEGILIEANDTAGWTFDDIANYVEVML